MSWNESYDSSGSKSAADLASSFLNSVGQELQGSSSGEPAYYESNGQYDHGHEEKYSSRERDDYHREKDYYRDEYRRSDRDSDYRRSSSRRYRDRSRDRRRGRSRSRDRHHHHHRSSRRGDDDYRRRRESSPHRRRRSSSRRDRDENIVPLHKRERKLNNWDVAPAGMEGMTAQQVKQTGLFPLPGQVVGTRTPQSFAPPSSHAYMADGSRVRVTQGAAGPVALNATLARQARRLYVGQIPFGVDENTMADFFNTTMQQFNTTNQDAVVSVQINHDKNYAFVEFQTPEQATAAMQFDGITFQNQTLKVRRPKDYQPPGGEYVDTSSTAVPDTPNKIFIGGLPIYLNDDQVIELLKSFGELRAFNLVKDPATGQSKGFAFCEYEDPSVTDLACQGLNNMELGEKKLVVQRASVGAHKHDHAAPSTMFMPMVVKEDDATRVVQLMNMVTPEELEDDEEYQDIWEDVAEECGKFGRIVDMKIPKPQGGQPVAGLGKIFLRYETTEEAMAALRALAGRKFADRTVVTSFVDEEHYLADNF
ncbi:hypothetical protein O0I10_008268 [Lichtheimia ornata]|uniref:Splicing factor U2AF subunit n=1 Tax=Lichtheimia ornata TaxID=688661 RepID=A0AAD7XX39_9FUNG|nr:uncharacterized protein O0I10_008268 [Lichtheimia ornata]KAJ8656046.1 hypothetical protein O0I10_008268 [Lichtheimia ornata]